MIISAVTGITDIVEGAHRNIERLSPIVGKSPKGGAGGIAGLVYSSVRGVTRGVGMALDASLSLMRPLLIDVDTPSQREALVSALNGAFGDHMVVSNNPMAIPMQLRQAGVPVVLERQLLAEKFSPKADRLLILVHGLCMNDLQWTRKGHDHGSALAQDLGYTPLYLHYNTGLHIDANGLEFADLLQTLVREWPVPLRELVIVGHSMGGLVTRSACHQAKQSKLTWLARLDKLICLGTPHLGAPLERATAWADFLMGISPYTAPYVGLLGKRSVGIKDLRYGDVAGDPHKVNAAVNAKPVRHAHAAIPLPQGAQCYAIAASKTPEAKSFGRLASDGLVSVSSALGKHEDQTRSLDFPEANQQVVYGLDHFDLLCDPAVYAQIKAWLEPKC